MGDNFGRVKCFHCEQVTGHYSNVCVRCRKELKMKKDRRFSRKTREQSIKENLLTVKGFD